MYSFLRNKIANKKKEQGNNLKNLTWFEIVLEMTDITRQRHCCHQGRVHILA